MKSKKCKHCKKEFKPIRPLQYLCGYSCATKYAKASKKAKEQAEKQKVKKIKESLLTHKDYLKMLQTVFNAYIRLRDKNLGCISCGDKTRQFHAGHYRSVGSAPHLRFNELNVHKQCAKCNTYLHGNLIDYRINLIKKIGLESVEALEQNNDNFKLSIPEIKEKIKEYKQRIKQLKDEI